jgi:hypothetical protein
MQTLAVQSETSNPTPLRFGDYSQPSAIKAAQIIDVGETVELDATRSPCGVWAADRPSH